MFPDELKKSVEPLLSPKNGIPVHIKETIGIGGGCINEAYELKTTGGKYFIKYNSAATFPGMFEKEAAGLKILADTNSIDIPEVIGSGEAGNNAYILLQYIESGIPARNFWTDFGTRLADLHRNTSDYFGLMHDNYIGSLVQTNNPNPDFFNFFISQRIEPQLKSARNKGAFSQSDMRYFNSLFNTLHNILPVEKPALIHGDLWSGNFMVSATGSPCLIDPAAYYGHRESDIAMTQLFGGFQPDFYHAYNQAFPMEKEWQKRMDIFNLYPLLVHVNLFGGSYAGQVLRIIRQF
jgi:protein-ribulosamine 3-kinase